MSDFDGRSFIVTGASSGIGWELARQLAERGARVAAMARTESKLIELRDEVGDRLLVAPGDVADEAQCAAVVTQAAAEFGGLDGLIHNAGITMRGAARETTTDVFRNLMEVNYFSLVYLYRSSIDHLVASRGHLVVVSSLMGLFSSQQRSGYAAAKHAVQGFMDSVRLEHLEHGVHVMVASPGYVRTNISLNALTADGSKHGEMDQGTGSGLEPRDVAESILDGISRRSRDVVPAGAREKFGLLLSRLSPRLLDRVLLRSRVT